MEKIVDVIKINLKKKKFFQLGFILDKQLSKDKTFTRYIKSTYEEISGEN